MDDTRCKQATATEPGAQEVPVAPYYYQRILQNLPGIARGLLWGISIVLVVQSVRSWAPLWRAPEAPKETLSFPVTDIALYTDSSSDTVPASTSEPTDAGIHHWFGRFKSTDSTQTPPADSIAISQRRLELIGIGTSSSPAESFALIRLGNGKVRTFRTGDTADHDAVLVDLLPNSVILKSGTDWEKLHIGTPPPDMPHHTAMGRPAAASRNSMAGADTAPTSTPRTNTASHPRRNDHPNRPNRDIRERLNTMMAALQQ